MNDKTNVGLVNAKIKEANRKEHTHTKEKESMAVRHKAKGHATFFFCICNHDDIELGVTETEGRALLLLRKAKTTPD